MEGSVILSGSFISLKSTVPKAAARMYPTTRPNSTESCFQYDFANTWNKIQESSVTPPRIQLTAEPNCGLSVPPPNEPTPTDRRENPIDVTTHAATIGATIFLQYFAKIPSVPSTIPPTIIAPIAVSYPYWGSYVTQNGNKGKTDSHHNGQA